MAGEKFQLKVYSGRGLEIEAETEIVTVPSAVGELGFLPHHCDYVGLLSSGVVEYKMSESPAVLSVTSSNRFVVTGGLCTFSNNTLKLLADSVDTFESIDRVNYGKDRSTLEERRQELNDIDPEFEITVQKISRIEAIDRLLTPATRN